MDPLFIELCRKLCRPGSYQANWGINLFFDQNPTYEEYLAFRKDRIDVHPFTRNGFENYKSNRSKRKKS